MNRKNKSMTEKELIISLIKDDLKHTKLISGMEELGLNCDQYYLQLNEIFFSLIGFKSKEWEERAYEEYLEYSKKVLRIDVLKHPEKVIAMANTIYDKLMEEKNYMD
jgi:hypothetical protein